VPARNCLTLRSWFSPRSKLLHVVSGSDGRSAHDSAVTAPGDRDQRQQAGTEQPNGGRDRHAGDVFARLRTEREDDVGDDGAGGGAGKRQRPRRRGVDERVVRIIAVDPPIGVGVRSRPDNQRGGTSRRTGQRIQVIVIPRGVGQQPLLRLEWCRNPARQKIDAWAPTGIAMRIDREVV